MNNSDKNNPLMEGESSPEEKPQEKNEAIAEETIALPQENESEAVFGKSTQDATYRENGYNAYGFSANGSYDSSTHFQEESLATKPTFTPEQKKRGVPSALIALSVFLFSLLVLLCVFAFVTVLKKSPTHTIGTRPARTDILEPWVNPAGLDSADSYALATAKTVNSVVVISTDNSSGSGVIWASHEEFSYILTCQHVIDGAQDVKITLHNGKSYTAEIIGSDARTDLAVLQIDAANLCAIVLPNETHELLLGQAVIAIGNPLGTLGNSVTNGILSSLTRKVMIENHVMELMQTNAAVNRGNSGGGLFDLNGQLIGLINAKSRDTTVEGIGFAIPYTTLKSIAAELIEKGYVSGRPHLGIKTVHINSVSSYQDAVSEYPDLKSIITQSSLFGTTFRPGVYIVDTSTIKGYAEGSKTLAFGDKIAAINGISINSHDDILSALNSHSAGETVQITVIRQNKSVNVELILDEVDP